MPSRHILPSVIETVLAGFPLLLFLAGSTAFGQTAAVPRAISPLTAAPAITILSAPAGVPVRTFAAGNAALDLGAVSYFKGASAPGESSRKNSGSFVISTRFALRVDCPAGSASSLVDVIMTRVDADASHAIAIDGTTLGSAPQIFLQSMPCGSAGEHRLDVEVPVSTPAGAIGSTVAFVATLRK
jgi:hypothetical protein